MPKPALFLCDRDELREQGYNKLKAVFGDNARIVINTKGENSAKNARIHIATYQTLGLDDEENDTANNLKYFGEPVYEYNLIQAQEDDYLAACEIIKRKASIDGKTFTGEEVLKAKPIDAKTGREIRQEEIKDQYTSRHFDSQLLIPERIAAMCEDLFKQLCQHGGPEQKAIIFCTREIHADRVAKQHYAFKCMGTANGGRELIEPMRGSGERAFIACTVDLLATGVDIERLNAVVFFRYLESSILFYQMVGRGTRIDEVTQKYKFWLYDYTGVTDLFGTDFISAHSSGKNKTGGGGGEDGGDDGEGEDEPPVIQIGGQTVTVNSEGRFILSRREGRDVKIPIEEYRREMLQRVLSEAGNLRDFRP